MAVEIRDITGRTLYRFDGSEIRDITGRPLYRFTGPVPIPVILIIMGLL